MASFSSAKPLSAAQLWDLLASNRVVVWGQRRSELEKQCLLTTRVRLDCDLDLVWGQDWIWSNLNFKRVSSVSVLSVSGVVFSLKRWIALSFTGESCMRLSPLFLRMSLWMSWLLESCHYSKSDKSRQKFENRLKVFSTHAYRSLDLELGCSYIIIQIPSLFIYIIIPNP
jgi:hypothetical protein